MTATAATAAGAVDLTGRHRRDWRAVQWRHPALALGSALVVFYLVFPLLVTIPISFNPVRRIEFPPSGYSVVWYRDFLGIGEENRNSRWVGATWLSIRIALATSVLSTVLGGLAAIPIARVQFRGKYLIQTILLLPLVLPVIVLAVGLFLFYVPLHMLGSSLGIVLGHTVLAIPYVTVIVAATLKNFDERLEWAAMSLGANRVQDPVDDHDPTRAARDPRRRAVRIPHVVRRVADRPVRQRHARRDASPPAVGLRALRGEPGDRRGVGAAHRVLGASSSP